MTKHDIPALIFLFPIILLVVLYGLVTFDIIPCPKLKEKHPSGNASEIKQAVIPAAETVEITNNDRYGCAFVFIHSLKKAYFVVRQGGMTEIAYETALDFCADPSRKNPPSPPSSREPAQ